MNGSISGPRRAELGVLAVASSGVIALGFAPAARLHVGMREHSVRFVDITVVGWVFIGLVGLLAIVGLVDGFSRDRAGLIVAVAYALLAVTAVGWIAVAEGLDALVPRSLLPATVRRFTVGLGAGYGAWVSAIALVIAGLAAWGKLDPLVERVIRRRASESDGAYGVRVGVLALLIGAVTMFAIGRDVPLVTVVVAGQSYPVRVWALPFGGVLSLVVLWVMVVCVIGVALDARPVVFACIGSAAAWIAATSSGLAVATTGLVAKESILRWVGDLTGRDGIASSAISHGGGAQYGLWFSMLAGLLFASSIAVAERP